MARRTTGRLATLASVAAIVVGAAIAAPLLLRGGGRSERVGLTDARGQRWSIELSAVPTQAPAGATIAIRLSVTNRTRELQTLSFPNAHQIDLVARDERDGVVWRSPEPSTQVLISRSVAPGDTLEYTRSWRSSGIPPGRYTLEGSILSRELEGRARARVETAVVLR